MMMMRARALDTLVGRAAVPLGEAVDIEHACFCIAAINGIPYSRVFFRALYALEHVDSSSVLRGAVCEKGAMYALALPDKALFGAVAARARVEQTDEKKAECTRVLRDLLVEAPSTTAELPEKGVKCAKCGSTDISFEFSQTRSADEGTTVFCYCTKCSKRWKM